MSHIAERAVLATAVVLLSLMAGCGSEDGSSTNPAAPAPSVKVPGPELGGVKQDLKNIQEDVKPPTVAGPKTSGKPE